jgi:hypothetical protein
LGDSYPQKTSHPTGLNLHTAMCPVIVSIRSKIWAPTASEGGKFSSHGADYPRRIDSWDISYCHPLNRFLAQHFLKIRVEGTFCMLQNNFQDGKGNRGFHPSITSVFRVSFEGLEEVIWIHGRTSNHPIWALSLPPYPFAADFGSEMG